MGAHVAEPYLQSSFRPQILFTAYFDGLTLADAFYRALPHLSWQAVVIGDPLTQPFGKPAPEPDLSPQADAITTLPSWFSARRVESLRADFPGTPEAALVQMTAAEAQLARDDRNGAIESLTRAAGIVPEMPAVHVQLASLHEQAGEEAKAVEGYRRVIALQPRNVIALNNLAYRLAMDDGNLDEALELAQRARTLAPDSAGVADTLGWVYHLRGDGAEAVKLLREAAKRAPNQPEIRLHAAFALAQTSALSEARGHLDAALKLDAALEGREDVQALSERLRVK